MNKKYRTLLDEGWEHGSDTFSDLGLEDAEQLQAKAYLRVAILSQIDALHITQSEAARRVGISQPKMSNLMADSAQRGFSSDKLKEFATKLGLDVKIQVQPSRSELGRVIVSSAARSKRSRAGAARRRGTKVA